MLHNFIYRTGLSFCGFLHPGSWHSSQVQLCSKRSFFFLLRSHTFPTTQLSSHSSSLTVFVKEACVEISTHPHSWWVEGKNRQLSSLVLPQARPFPESCGHQGALPGKTVDAVSLHSSWGIISPHKTVPFRGLQVSLGSLSFLIPVFKLYGYIEKASVGIWSLILWQNDVSCKKAGKFIYEISIMFLTNVF